MAKLEFVYLLSVCITSDNHENKRNSYCCHAMGLAKWIIDDFCLGYLHRKNIIVCNSGVSILVIRKYNTSFARWLRSTSILWKVGYQFCVRPSPKIQFQGQSFTSSLELQATDLNQCLPSKHLKYFRKGLKRIF